MPMTINDQNGNIIGSTTNPMLITQAPKAPNQSLKTFTGVATTSTGATTVVNLGYTVASGKTFYLTDVIICNNSSNASQVSVNGSLTIGASPILIGHAINTSPLEALNIGSEPSITAGGQLSVQLGQTTTATSCTYFIAGYEQ